MDMMDMSSEVDGVRKSRVDQNLVDPNTGNWACSTFDLEKIRKGAYSVALQSVSLPCFPCFPCPRREGLATPIVKIKIEKRKHLQHQADTALKSADPNVPVISCPSSRG